VWTRSPEGGFGDRSSPISGVYGIVRNALLEYMRWRKVERSSPAQLASEAQLPTAFEGSDTRRVLRFRDADDSGRERSNTRSEDWLRSDLHRAMRGLRKATGIEENER